MRSDLGSSSPKVAPIKYGNLRATIVSKCELMLTRALHGPYRESLEACGDELGSDNWNARSALNVERNRHIEKIAVALHDGRELLFVSFAQWRKWARLDSNRVSFERALPRSCHSAV
jgi:hypothetical protein